MGKQKEAKYTKLKNPTECEFCDRKFKYRKSFIHHMQTEHGMSDESDVPLSAYITKPRLKEEANDPTLICKYFRITESILKVCVCLFSEAGKR